MNALPIDTVPNTPTPQDTTNKATIDTQKSVLTYTPEPTKRTDYREVVGVRIVGGTVYGTASVLHRKDRKLY